MLQVSQLHQYYGGSHILRGVDFSARQGEVTCLLGRNGVGKTTLLKCLMGLIPARSGEVRWQDQNITHRKPHQRVQAGVAYVPQGREIFPRLTVEENLLMGTIPIGNRYQNEDKARMYQLFPRLEERRAQRAMTLSGGEQQMLAIARALMSRPKLLLLDEPSLGLAPLVVKQIFSVLRELTDLGMTLLLVEQNAHHALKLANRAYVLVNGEIRLSGSGAELLDNPEVRNAYLGMG